MCVCEIQHELTRTHGILVQPIIFFLIMLNILEI